MHCRCWWLVARQAGAGTTVAGPVSEVDDRQTAFDEPADASLSTTLDSARHLVRFCSWASKRAAPGGPALDLLQIVTSSKLGPFGLAQRLETGLLGSNVVHDAETN
jgi:hypothetical protein